MSSKKRRINLAIAKRRRWVADLYLQGWTQMEIAERIAVGQSTICIDLKRVRRDWRESMVRDFDLAREIELHKLDRIEKEAWAAWERSQKPAQSARIDETDPARRKSRRHVKNRYGDPRFLEQINRCIASRRALLGLDAPGRVEVETDGYTVDERRDRIVAVVAALRERRGAEATGDGPGGGEPRLLGSDHQQG